MSKIHFTFSILLTVLFIGFSRAQERQIPILPAKNLWTIDKTFQKELHLFPEYKNFSQAQLFQINDSSFVLEISYRQEGQFLKSRIPYSPTRLKKFRRMLLERLAQSESSKVAIDQRGRTKFLIATTVLSAGFYGWALPAFLDISNERLSVALYMATASAGFFVPYYLTKNVSLSDGAANLAIYGGTRGIIHGILLSNIFLRKRSAHSKLGLTVFTSLTEMTGGLWLAKAHKLSNGTSETIGVCGDYGFLLGGQLGVIADFYRDGFSKAANAAILGGSILGMATGRILSNKQSYSKGDALVLSASMWLGSYLPLALVDLTNSKNLKHFALASMVGTIGGLWFGHRLTREVNFSTGQGRLIELGEWSGGLLGFGLAYLLTPGNSSTRSKIYLLSSAIGTTIGFWGMYHSFADKATRLSFEAKPTHRLRFDFLPAGLLGLMTHDDNRFTPPLLNCSLRF